jgi:thioredoxin 2
MTTATSTVTLRCQFCDTWNRVDASRAGDRPKCGHCSRFLLIDRPWILKADTFQRTIDETEIPVAVDFYADWCGPCRTMAPAVDALAAQYTGRVLVAKLNTDLAQEVSNGLGIRGIPTTIVFKGGREVARATGAHPLPGLVDLVERALTA